MPYWRVYRISATSKVRPVMSRRCSSRKLSDVVAVDRCPAVESPEGTQRNRAAKIPGRAGRLMRVSQCRRVMLVLGDFISKRPVNSLHYTDMAGLFLRIGEFSKPARLFLQILESLIYGACPEDRCGDQFSHRFMTFLRVGMELVLGPCFRGGDIRVEANQAHSPGMMQSHLVVYKRSVRERY